MLPQVPMWQWVLAMPPELQVRVVNDPRLETRLLAIFTEELSELLRATAKADPRAQGGSVTFIQHFGSALNLHPHFHCLALDGVYEPGATPEEAPRFVRAPEPTPDQVRWVCTRVAERARKLVKRRPWPDPEEMRQLPVLRVHGAEPREPAEMRLHARVERFDLHVSTAFEAQERAALERFCRYGLRGLAHGERSRTIASGRLQRGPREMLTCRLKAPKPDGTTELVLSPMALLERLARLVPRRRQHLIRYGGVLAGGATLRAEVVPAPPGELPLIMRRAGPRRLDWANLLRRVFLLEVLACACGAEPCSAWRRAG